MRMFDPLGGDEDEPEESGRFLIRHPKKNKCLECGSEMTHRECRKQYARAIKYGLTKEEASAASPRCQKCMTKHAKKCHR